MTAQQYAEQQRQINLQAAALTYMAMRQFQQRDMSTVDWLALLELLYPVIERARTQSSVLARQFYDEQRAIHLPDAPDYDIDLVGYDRTEFRLRMEPERLEMSQEDAPDEALNRVVLRALKEVQGAGRKTIVRAVENEPEPEPKEREDERQEQQLDATRDEPKQEPKWARDVWREQLQAREAQRAEVSAAERFERPRLSVVPPLQEDPKPAAPEPKSKTKAKEPKRRVQGWARVATNPKPCAFCLMLVSRGPVYASAETAGFTGKNKQARKLHEAGSEKAMRLAMRKFHPGCGCIVVPVFDKQDWPGRDSYLAAEDIWKESTKDLHGQDAVIAFRRAVEHRYRESQKAARTTGVA
ncbi:VG15 protein [Nocardia sp. IFM 10818]